MLHHFSSHVFFCILQSSSGSRPRAADQLACGREITKCLLVVTQLAFWAWDWPIFPMEALLRA